jgi:hypothetical protein
MKLNLKIKGLLDKSANAVKITPYTVLTEIFSKVLIGEVYVGPAQTPFTEGSSHRLLRQKGLDVFLK